MSRVSEVNLRKPEHGDSFEERVDMLFEELSFALRMQRPSILLVSYASEYLRDIAELALKKRLAQIGQKMVPFPVDQEHFDIPLLLARDPQHDHSIYSVTDLSRGGGKSDANAYRALNMRRELLVDCAIRVVFWLTREDAVALSLHAPDFWAFRHRVLDFNDAVNDYGLFIKQLKQGLAAAREWNDVPLLSKLWGDMGQVYLEAGQMNRAARAYWKAIRLAPQEAGLWRKLGHFYHTGGRFRDAIMAYRQAILLDPQDPSTRSTLVAYYRLLGKEKLAEE